MFLQLIELILEMVELSDIESYSCVQVLKEVIWRGKEACLTIRITIETSDTVAAVAFCAATLFLEYSLSLKMLKSV